ncbi:type II toxin-antitoxin system VapC family toxin [Mycobacterium haemophilum]|uniref:Ribonuclease VapC n=1 Tax=Mycobacterium haemophilum TaxID=29311 RepID=A0A0I9UYJ0_9MYCO|nr:type II toxin-antitoxin system VapC family toxin [Mycobacterium haemophilum]AKN15439.1 ribonuclease [Mycobacterium haemophilum DSM 44634]KLO27960.1 ribonuclease [Mycobacterium haemophilum]KLO35379.1 ribonuclease [Mycobacterium haemophilum]KLO40568.1 ribonuclease [Mycobacterium haemophilum]KLO47986.1 ribonuclease [Mycobacterium haemophilum]
MIIDTSAIVALIQDEQPHTGQVVAALAGARSPVMSAPTVAECLIVLTARHGPVGRTIFERLRSEINLGVEPFTYDHATAAQRAFLQYGKGRHPAALNFGDCMSYAAAQLSHQPLLAVGNDFAQTDLEFSGVIGHWPTPNETSSASGAHKRYLD